MLADHIKEVRMILNGSYSDNSKELIQSFDEEINRNNAELETAQAENADMKAALEVMEVVPE